MKSFNKQKFTEFTFKIAVFVKNELLFEKLLITVYLFIFSSSYYRIYITIILIRSSMEQFEQFDRVK